MTIIIPFVSAFLIKNIFVIKVTNEEGQEKLNIQNIIKMQRQDQNIFPENIMFVQQSHIRHQSIYNIFTVYFILFLLRDEESKRQQTSMFPFNWFNLNLGQFE